jgi:hypothetical protein
MIGNENVAKSSNIFICNLCNYKTDKKFNYDKHVLTRKHLKSINGNEFVEKNSEKIYECETCNKNYKDLSGLWRHKKKCKPLEDVKQITDSSNNTLILELIKQNQEFQKQILELVKEKGFGNVTNNTNSNNKTTNNRFNINMFLNEKCKDAMNIMDFVDSLKLTLQDLEKTAELGYVKGITNIIVNGLNELDVYKRPIHCSDVKRETLYVKDNNIWEKENEEKKKLTRAIKHISIKNAKQVGEWTKENKGYNDSSCKKNDKYLKIITEANGGEPEEINKIISNVSSKVTIDKQPGL